jgi:hypothetical protein
LYKTTTLGTPKKIRAFRAAIYKPNSRTYERKYKLVLHVRHLWIGTTDIPRPYGEDHESPEVDLMVQILQACTGLRAIALFAVGIAAWNRLLNALPPCIESLTYDYSGDPIPRAFISAPAVRRIMTVLWRRHDSDLRSMVADPWTRYFTQFFPGFTWDARVALERLPIITQSLSPTIERVRVVIFRGETDAVLDGGDQSDVVIVGARKEPAEFLADEQVRVVARHTMEANWK